MDAGRQGGEGKIKPEEGAIQILTTPFLDQTSEKSWPRGVII